MVYRKYYKVFDNIILLMKVQCGDIYVTNIIKRCTRCVYFFAIRYWRVFV